MSLADSLSISYHPEKPEGEQFAEVYLGREAACVLYDYMLPRMEAAAPGCAEEFEGLWLVEDLSLRHIPERYWLPVFNLVMQACDAETVLKPFKSALKKALESRYD
ncbi:hypothetical protein [Neisseria zoodegmatis]|uniref:Uncharacterized protein n=1 Tax=Neisseria zoodegmatis TaxID=326523 RepID=A0AB38DMU7_9NEIS|nr:hypothetical protein [Neisseria zoodegmatis]OSI09276.1 hypothetical protein BWD10_10125 [Neisseria zoodegmatis]SNU78688.1 Uncharacterised protein [Neisseria zoodegmatis]